MIASRSEEEPLLITITQAAQLCSVSYWTIWRLIQAGRLEAVDLTGRTIRVRRDSLERYLAQSSIPQSSPAPNS